MLPTQDPLPPPIGLFFHPCEEEGLSKLVAHLPTGKGAVVVLTAQRSVADMNQPGWYLVKIGFPPDTKIALADPVLTQDILEASQDLLANMLDFGFELRTDDRPSIPNDIAILFFDDVGAEPLKAQLTLPTGTVDVIASSDFDEFMDEPRHGVRQPDHDRRKRHGRPPVARRLPPDGAAAQAPASQRTPVPRPDRCRRPVATTNPHIYR